MQPTLFSIENPQVKSPKTKTGYERLTNAIGNISDWHYTGIMIDHQARVGQCACGCKIRYAHVIENKYTKDSTVVGIVCIESIPEFNHIVDEIRQHEIQLELKELETLIDTYNQFQTKVKNFKEWFESSISKWLPAKLFDMSHKGCKYEELKSNKAKIKKIKNYLEKNQPLLESIRKNPRMFA